MSREVCGMCWCPYGDDGRCACPVEEEVSSKPVAWMGITANGFQRLSIEKLDENDIPLYTHPAKQLSDTYQGKYIEQYWNKPPVKQLSDDEIKQIWYDLYPLSSSSYWDDKREGLAELKFARAIIKEITE